MSHYLDDSEIESAVNEIMRTPVGKLTEEGLAEVVGLCAEMRVNSVLGALLYETIRHDRPDMRLWIENRLRHMGHTDLIGNASTPEEMEYDPRKKPASDIKEPGALMSLTEFEDAVRPKVGDDWPAADKAAFYYGPRLRWDVANVLCHAANLDQKRKVALAGTAEQDETTVRTVIDRLERHHQDTLQFVHPELRTPDHKPTCLMFVAICRDVLGLEPDE